MISTLLEVCDHKEHCRNSSCIIHNEHGRDKCKKYNEDGTWKVCGLSKNQCIPVIIHEEK
jgi:hypothetical protein